ncbi:hypothetical protein EEB19_14890 [Gordonia sp. OPL2]|nr:hypothetical protein EEB19_14890 [Gordonia sp. OPL2]
MLLILGQAGHQGSCRSHESNIHSTTDKNVTSLAGTLRCRGLSTNSSTSREGLSQMTSQTTADAPDAMVVC